MNVIRTSVWYPTWPTQETWLKNRSKLKVEMINKKNIKHPDNLGSNPAIINHDVVECCEVLSCPIMIKHTKQSSREFYDWNRIRGKLYSPFNNWGITRARRKKQYNMCQGRAWQGLSLSCIQQLIPVWIEAAGASETPCIVYRFVLLSLQGRRRQR